jgi:hypothetical protein
MRWHLKLTAQRVSIIIMVILPSIKNLLEPETKFKIRSSLTTIRRSEKT